MYGDENIVEYTHVRINPQKKKKKMKEKAMKKPHSKIYQNPMSCRRNAFSILCCWSMKRSQEAQRHANTYKFHKLNEIGRMWAVSQVLSRPHFTFQTNNQIFSECMVNIVCRYDYYYYYYYNDDRFSVLFFVFHFESCTMYIFLFFSRLF